MMSPPPDESTRKAALTAGFTLIELSIVLVIIGLIVGGVLVGQDLVKAAGVRATISQIEKFNT
jgi:prepilin-type N-terminal cleavage/methylation domain-containing protein